MGLFTADLKGGLVEVLAIPVEEDRDPMLAAHEVEDEDQFVSLRVAKDDVPKCLRAISSGKEMTFMLTNPIEAEFEPFLKPPLDPVVKLPLPNDYRFKELCDETYERVANAQDATGARHLSEGWYRRRTSWT